MRGNSFASQTGKAIPPSSLGGAGGAMELIESHDFGAPATSYSFTGLDGDDDEVYKLVYKIVIAVAVAINVDLQPNGVTTNQLTYATYGGTAGAGTVNPAALRLLFNAAPTIGDIVTGTLSFDAKTGTRRSGRANWADVRAANIFHMDAVLSWTDTAANITSLDIVSDQANGIAAGSYVRLYKLLKV